MNIVANGQVHATHRARRFQFGLASMLLVIAAFSTCFGVIRLWGVLSRGPLLPYWLVDFICYVSGFAFLGGIAGTLCGFAAGAAIGTIRKRHAAGLPTGLLFGLVAGASTGSAMAVCVATLEAVLCRPGGKGGYLIPEWAFWLGPCLVLFTAGLAATFAVPRGQTDPSPRRVFVRVIIWTASSALLGALALSWFGFSGYRSNEPPMRSALTGFIICGVGALACLTLGELLLRLEYRRATPKV